MDKNGRTLQFARRVPGAAALLAAAAMLVVAGCLMVPIKPPSGTPVTMKFVVTGYCDCGICCSWERSWFGFGPPVYSSGPNKGKRKQVGITASGERTRRGTVAADTAVLPFGTVVHVPGYGYGKVMDRGGAIKGNSLDLWFSSHQEARKWGRRTVQVKVWR